MLMADAAVEQTDQPKTKVFISYSRKDIAFADRLDSALKARGLEPLIDRTEIYAFEEWWKRIEALIGQADTVVFVLSPDAVRSESVARKEVAFAASLKKRFAPIVYRPVDDKLVPEELAKLNFIFFDEPTRFETSADQLADALQTDIGWIRQHTEYGEAERRWSAAGRPSGLLLQSPTLEVAEHWIVSRPRGAPEPTEEIKAFVAASRKGAHAAQRLRRVVMASMFTLLVGIILGLVGWINQDYIKQRWTWYTSVRPFLAANFWPYELSTAAESALISKDSFRECAFEQGKDYCPAMVVVPSGSFTMGSSPESIHEASEEPQHVVTIAKPFAASKFEVTFDEWDTCAAYGDCSAGVSDLGWGRGQRPVIFVSWDDAQRYVAWLSRITGKPYRLLTEAEYEYAARAGTTTTFPWGDEVQLNGMVMANCDGCGSQWDNTETAPVGSFPPNRFGLYDMVGNIYEWVADCFHPDYTGAPTDGSNWTIACPDVHRHVARAGSWGANPSNIRSATRKWLSSDAPNRFLGFRVARTLLAP
jgi:formylglycine-generating enzyme required for sulfatase activity